MNSRHASLGFVNVLPGIIGLVDSPLCLCRVVMSNYVLVRADRSTHVKIIVVSLIACFMVIGVGIAARPPVSNAGLQLDDNGVARTIKAGKPAAWSSREQPTIR